MKDFRSTMIRGSQTNLDPELKPAASARPIVVPGDFFLDLANSAWDLKKASRDPISGEPRPHLNKVARHVERLWDALERVGLTMQDHYNQPFDSGQSLEVLAFQPTPGVRREIVAETIKPTVHLQGQRIQVGQVIVATPQGSGGSD